MWPLRNVGSLTDEYSLTSDWDNQWLTGGLGGGRHRRGPPGPESIFAGVARFAKDRTKRLEQQRGLLKALDWV